MQNIASLLNDKEQLNSDWWNFLSKQVIFMEGVWSCQPTRQGGREQQAACGKMRQLQGERHWQLLVRQRSFLNQQGPGRGEDQSGSAEVKDQGSKGGTS